MYADDENTDTAAVGDATAEASFGSGFAGAEDKTDTKPPANGKDEPARDAAQADAEPPPEVVQITAKEWAEVRAAAAKTASYDQQLSKAFGTIGNLQKLVNGFQQKAQSEPPPKRKVEISQKSYAKMAADFPELAEQSREALQDALSELNIGANDVDENKIEAIIARSAAKREIEALEDAYPDWRTIVGAVDVTKDQPDPENPFRKWLGTKDAAYQDRVNASESAAVIGRAIRLFQRETAVPAAKPAARDTARADRIRAAVQPRGDNAGAAPSNTAEEAFAAGFARN